MNRTLHVPPFINYSCHTCGWCCRQYDITFSQSDYDRLARYDWGKLEPALAGKEWVAPLNERNNPDKFRLRYDSDGACVFLGPDNLCRMHKHVGELGKTLGCCVYPFTFVSTPSGIYVGLRFSCKAVAYGLGDPIVRRKDALSKQLELCERSGHLPVYPDTVPFSGNTVLGWTDYMALEETLVRVILRDDLPLTRRLFLVHKLLDVLQQAKLDRVRGDKFRQLLGILESGLMTEAVNEPMPSGAGWLPNMMYRQFHFLFQRRQGGAYRELSPVGRLAVRLRNFLTGVQFALNCGSPRLPALEGKTPLRRIAQMAREPLDPTQELTISRFLAAKLYGKQHFGKLFYNYSLLHGLSFWLLASGTVMWYARAHALARGAEHVEDGDVFEAVRYVDFCYGYSSAPGLVMERMRVGILSRDDTAIRLALGQYDANG